jgi:hypothetical protein
VDGYWQFQDAVFMKTPLLEHLKRRERDVTIANKAARNMVKDLHQQFKDEGAGLPDEMIDRLLGDDVDPNDAKKRNLKRLI